MRVLSLGAHAVFWEHAPRGQAIDVDLVVRRLRSGNGDSRPQRPRPEPRPARPPAPARAVAAAAHGALERVGGIQAQYAPPRTSASGAGSRDSRLRDLTRALERRRAVQGTLLRSTIHLVSAGDYWAFAPGARPRGSRPGCASTEAAFGADMEAAAKEVRAALAGRVAHRDELLELARRRYPERPTHLWNGLAAWVELVRAPPSGTWERRRADLYALAEEWVGPPATTPAEGADAPAPPLPRRFGPARLADAANWAGLPVADLEPAAERLQTRTFTRRGRRASCSTSRARRFPAPTTPAPARFLPTWDATLLVHARRTQILPEDSVRSSSPRRPRSRRRRSWWTARSPGSGRSSGARRRQPWPCSRSSGYGPWRSASCRGRGERARRASTSRTRTRTASARRVWRDTARRRVAMVVPKQGRRERS